MDIRPIRTEDDYDWALAEITPYFEKEPAAGTPDADRFDVLAALIGAYENEHWNIEAADPVETIKTYMASRQLGQKDLAGVIGSTSRASEVLHKKRKLTLDMIHKLSDRWSIPAEVLVKPYHLIETRDGERAAERTTRSSLSRPQAKSA